MWPSATLTGDATFTNAGTGDCGNAQLQPSHSCSAQITFLPTTAGTSNATVTFTDDDGSVAGSTQAVSLQGNALLPNIQATPTSVSFPDLALGRITQRQTGGHQEYRGSRPHRLRPASERRSAEELRVAKAELHRPRDRRRRYLHGERAVRAA